ncbi:alkylation response protein AidB-like acyl-CoA dehydrogenase [Tepidamorphus gemmatus]|jgi:short/branched chain acyl-CoA dehydrogenase|uniref:Alkylation response protein AidB-like acyl-CoA dehydrogenase n=1 Tax=Tepidamorphus gemmatus TaxID=747076 RepID=A0A4V2V003_9HYPH|nr:acyl-CoA dehydrogenase family protein [Tepidamorphus gemmatus]TCT13439.1 alkylation response protein AidB-like acyl-CoA dehydrogenase [Tepidamorphus gemmatus]
MDFDLTPDQKALQANVRDFAQSEIAPRAEQLDRDGVFPTDLFQRLGELGVMSIPFPEELGGMGLGVFEAVLALEEVARADQSLAVSAMVSMATGLTVARFGTEAQKRRWLPDIVAGRKICSIAGTEPDAGSWTAGFKTRATEVAEGQWSISGEKAYITNPGTDISSFTLVLCVSSPKEEARKQYTLFLVPNDAPGYTRGEKYRKMGWKSSDTRPLFLDDVRLTDADIVGQKHGGRWVLHKGYQAARLFLAACSLGLAQASLDHSIAYAKERQAFGGSIGRLQLVQDMIARMALKTESARLVTYRAAWLVDQGRDDLMALSMAKLHATETGSEVANLAIQVHGGWGFMDDCPVSRYLRDNRICTIGDGSSQIQTLLIARECGLDVTFQ